MNLSLCARRVVHSASIGGAVKGFLLVLVVLTLSACQSAERRAKDTVIGSGVSPRPVYAESAIGPDIRRVYVLPVRGMDDPESAEKMRAVFAEELQRTGRFEVLHLQPEQRAHADAVLQVDVLAYHPYKPMALGVRTTLARARDGFVLWAADDHFQAGNPAVARSAERFGQDRYRPAYPAPGGESLLLSPTRFAHFVAATLFTTLPPLVVSPATANP